MAIPVYLWLYSEEGKQLKGGVDVHRREGSIEITGLSHGVEIPTDDYSGKITATRQHSPFFFLQKRKTPPVLTFIRSLVREVFLNLLN